MRICDGFGLWPSSSTMKPVPPSRPLSGPTTSTCDPALHPVPKPHLYRCLTYLKSDPLPKAVLCYLSLALRKQMQSQLQGPEHALCDAQAHLFGLNIVPWPQFVADIQSGDKTGVLAKALAVISLDVRRRWMTLRTLHWVHWQFSMITRQRRHTAT